MNYGIFKEWFMKILTMLEEPSVIVAGNASYPSMELTKHCPQTQKLIFSKLVD